MNIKNKLGRVVGIAAAATAIGGLGLTGVASASTAAPAMKAHVSQPSSTAVPARDHSPDWYCTWWKYTTFGTWCLAYHL